ncbi:3'-5' exonuclease [Clostridium minihomine]|uniref:3'-5' exonuclease n=1 Tax=Clostridium minihomine TaxID=2045012 RepID=UPI000C784E8F|nr:3'-5' exonuclease [Clostridium minihomine]
MNLIILDLEWNGTYSRRLKGYINEIIEFGAVRVDESLTVVDTFHAFVRPQVGKKISGKIQNLTRLRNEDLEDGILFMQAVSRFKKWAGDGILMTWGTSDLLALIENCRYFCGNGHIPFLKEYVDLQRYCESRLPGIGGMQMGLSTCASLLGIEEEESEHHRALNDSMLSLDCFRILYQKEAFLSMVQDADDPDFYPRLTFKTVVLSDWDHPLVQTADMTVYCDQCGREAERLGDWIIKNKSFRADFYCAPCDYRFVGRIQLKLKYDGLIIKKKNLPFQPEETEQEGEDLTDSAEELQELDS